MDETKEALACGAALHWYDSPDRSWYRYDGIAWQGWQLIEANQSWAPTSKRMPWFPWVQLLDKSRYPYMVWFTNAETNFTFTALDSHCLEGRGNDVAFETALSDENEESYSTISRFDLLRAVCLISSRLRTDLGDSQFMPRSERCLFHVRTSFEHVTYMLACARLGSPYTCTAIDASDSAIMHRLEDFDPTVFVVTADEDIRSLPGSQASTRMRTLLRDNCSCTPRILKPLLLYTVTNGTVASLLAHTVERIEYECSSQIPALAVNDSHVLCVVYTSGSTGRPKGIVHGHGGYASCLSRSMKFSLEATRSDKILTIGTFSWITGQSYMLVGPLLIGCCSILIDGSPLGFDGLRWARVAKERRASVLKLASTLVRHIMNDYSRVVEAKSLNLVETLRLGTFCAEPVSRHVQQWACETLCSRFVNSYWATEHGAIILTSHTSRRFQPDAKCWPVPWVKCTLEHNNRTLPDDLGDIVLVEPYPGLARTVWGDVEGYVSTDKEWTGDLDRFKRSYFPWNDHDHLGFGFVQGDSARVDKVDGGWTFHGRSDEVLNIAGVRVGIEEIESVLWRLNGVADLAVVGAPDEVKGEIPITFVVYQESFTLPVVQLRHMFHDATRRALGLHAEPDVLVIRELPKTVSGKTSRSLLRDIFSGKVLPQSEVGRAIANVRAYWDCVQAVDCWRRTKMCSNTPIFTRRDWTSLCVDSHVILGSPIVPATGWLVLLYETFRHEQLQDVQFLHIVREKTQFIARKHANRVDIIPSISIESGIQSCGKAYVRCMFPRPSSISLLAEVFDCGSENPTAWYDENKIVDDIDGYAHYRRCRSVGLQYTGPYSCVTRVVWHVDFKFRVDVQVPKFNLAALLDAALQVVCCVDALGFGVALIPFAIEHVQLRKTGTTPCKAVILGKLTSRKSTTVTADFVYFGVDAGSVSCASQVSRQIETDDAIAVMLGVSFSVLNASQRLVKEHVAYQDGCVYGNCRSAVQNPGHVAGVGDADVPSRLTRGDTKTANSKSAPDSRVGTPCISELQKRILEFGETLTGGLIDPSRSLFENGLYSMRSVELIKKINEVYNSSIKPRDVAKFVTVGELAMYLQSALKTCSVKKSKMDSDLRQPCNGFGHVDLAALNRIAQLRSGRQRAYRMEPTSDESVSSSARVVIREAVRAVTYMLRRGFYHCLRIQYRDGLYHFLLVPPPHVDLNVEVVVPGLRVSFNQTDYNRHFTVREIIRDSERGFYNLVHASGLAHLEHYYKVMFFASRLEARFDSEVLEGEHYEMRVSVSTITGPLIDVEVAFHKVGSRRRDSSRAFAVTWRLILVTDSFNKKIYDFERGGVFSNNGPPAVKVKTGLVGSYVPIYRRCSSMWLAAGVALVGLNLLSFVPRIIQIANTVLCAAFMKFSLIEVSILTSTIILWMRAVNRLETCEGPVETVFMPHLA